MGRAVVLAVVFLVMTFIVGLLGGVVFGLLGGMVDQAGEFTTSGLRALPWLNAAALIVASLVVLRMDDEQTAWLPKASAARSTLYFVLPVLMLVLGSTLMESAALQAIPVRPDRYLELLEPMLASPLWVSIVTVVLVPAVFEELAFRGVIQPHLVRSYGPTTGIVVTALLFALVHINLYQAIPVFIAGVVFGYIRHMAGSVYPAMLAHALGNLVAVLSWHYVVPTGPTDVQVGQILSTAGWGLLFLGVGASVAWLVRRHISPEDEAAERPSSVLTGEVGNSP